MRIAQFLAPFVALAGVLAVSGCALDSDLYGEGGDRVVDALDPADFEATVNEAEPAPEHAPPTGRNEPIQKTKAAASCRNLDYTPGCVALGLDELASIDEPDSGEHSNLNGDSFSIVNYETSVTVTSTREMRASIVSGGAGTRVCVYDEPQTELAGLRAPQSPATGAYVLITDVVLCE